MDSIISALNNLVWYTGCVWWVAVGVGLVLLMLSTFVGGPRPMDPP